MVLSLDLYNLFPDNGEIPEVPFYPLLVLGSDVGLTKGHQVLQVVPCIENQAPDRRVGDHIL